MISLRLVQNKQLESWKSRTMNYAKKSKQLGTETNKYGDMGDIMANITAYLNTHLAEFLMAHGTEYVFGLPPTARSLKYAKDLQQCLLKDNMFAINTEETFSSMFLLETMKLSYEHDKLKTKFLNDSVSELVADMYEGLNRTMSENAGM